MRLRGLSLGNAAHFVLFFFFNDTATTEIYTLSLHDALPICESPRDRTETPNPKPTRPPHRSEEHTSELQSPCNLVCRLLLEKKKQKIQNHTSDHEPPSPTVCVSRMWHV